MTNTPLPKHTRITGEQRTQLARELAARYQAGATLRTLTTETGRSYGFVRQILTDTAGITMRQRGGDRRPRRKADRDG